MSEVTLKLVYDEVKTMNQRIAALEHLLIPEEKISAEEAKELDELVKDAVRGNVTPFSKIKK